ncbi:MAG: ERF family protein [Paraclostridium sp.]
MKKVLQKINEVRNEIDVPKTRYNSHSGFYFRNLGDIYNAINPVFLEKKLALHFLEDIEIINNQNYLKVTAVVYDLESDEQLEVTVHAKEPLQKSNFDTAQITTSTSSVAKKSALSTLLCLDDSNDKSDKKPESPAENKPKFDKNTSLASEKQVKLIYMLMKQTNSDKSKWYDRYKIESFETATFAKASEIIDALNKKKENMNKDA